MMNKPSLISAIIPVLFSMIGIADARVVYGQTSDTKPASFEVASIRVNRSGERSMSFQITPERLMIRNANLGALTTQAYGVFQQAFTNTAKIRLPTDRYDIEAKPAQQANRTEMMRMLQALLADRFKLTLDRKAEVVSGYALVVDSGGHKLREHAGDAEDCVISPAAGGKIQLKNCTMEAFVTKALAAIVYGSEGRRVADQTGLDGTYDFELAASCEVSGGCPLGLNQRS